MTKVTFFTDEFRRSHGKQPRGFGRWGFHFSSCFGAEVYLEFTPHSMSYADAKKWALAHARAEKFDQVSVAP